MDLTNTIALWELKSLPSTTYNKCDFSETCIQRKIYNFDGTKICSLFQPPRPALPWDGIKKATNHGPKCPQVDIFRNKIQLGSEDCLHLNVYTPALKPESPLPVMVFIHGGCFKTSSGNSKNFGPDFLVPHGVVFVTINYRLEVLGFLCLDSKEVPGNAGMKDQVAALRWISKNIGSFGGDPNNVTIVGENSGGVCTALHMFSPMSKGLFKRVICMNGVPFCDWATAFEPQKRAYVLGKQLGIDTDEPNVLLDYLQKVSVEELINTNPTILSIEEHDNHLLKLCHFTPVIEKDFGQERFLTEDVLEALKTRRISNIDVLIGHTSEEAILEISIFEKHLKQVIGSYDRYPELLVTRKIQIMCTPNQTLELSKRIRNYYFKGKPISMDTLKEFITFLNHSGFEYDINSFASKLSTSGDGRLYMYKFSSVSSRNVYGNPGLKYGIKGASHLDDLMYLMHAKLYNLKLEKNTREYELVQLMCTLFTNFAKFGYVMLPLNWCILSSSTSWSPNITI